MTAGELNILLTQGEGQHLEFKQDAIKPADLAETFVALANAQGGIVLIGVNDRGEPVGIRSYEDAYNLVMTAASHELCDPPIPLEAEPVALASTGQVIAVRVPRSDRLHATHGRFLIRRGSQNVSLTTAEVAERTRRLHTGELTALRLPGGYQALYEVLSYKATLDLQDVQGASAVLERDQQIRFLQDGVVGLYHQVWGEGELLDDYEVEPGVVADRFQLGGRHITLISLRQIKNRGDRLHLHIRRQIRGGWTAAEEWLEIAINHRTRLLQVTVSFPKERPPRRAFLIEQSTGSVQALEQRDWETDSQGRTLVVWQTKNPLLGDSYLVRWEW